MRSFVLAFVLPIVLTAASLGRASWNRSQTHGTIVLSQREMTASWHGGDRSGTSFWLRWSDEPEHGPSWLTAARLASLGFDVSVPPASPAAERHYATQLRRDAFVALRMEERAAGSRLVPVDADRDPAALAGRHLDRQRTLILAGSIAVRLHRTAGERPAITGAVAEVVPQRLHVPRTFADRFPRQRTGEPPAFKAVLTLGRSFEPWVSDVSVSGAPSMLVSEVLAPRTTTSDGSRPDVGGLSGAFFDPGTQTLWAVSDDTRRPRLLAFPVEGLHVRPEPRRVSPVQLDGTGVTLDLEAIAPAADGGFFVSSEGTLTTSEHGRPGIYRCTTDGACRPAFALPPYYLSTDPALGMRSNEGLEGLSTSPDRTILFAATEQSLRQDGTAPTPDAGTVLRILRYDTSRPGVAPVEYAYRTDPLPRRSEYHDPAGLMGVSDILAESATSLLVLERGFIRDRSSPVRRQQNTIRIYRVGLDERAAVTGRPQLDPSQPVLAKTLVVDLASTAEQLSEPLRTLENFEGMAWGPVAGEGMRTLLLVSDDNFSARQVTAFVLLRWPVRRETGTPEHRRPDVPPVVSR